MSNYTEKKILSMAIKILEEVGAMTTTELKEALNEEMKPTGNDLKINLNRNDTKFDQKVRNMISHRQNNDLLLYCEYRRAGSNGLLKSKTIINKKSSKDDKEEIKKRRKQKKRFISRKIDFDEVNERNKVIGLMGEEFVFRNEREKLNPTLAKKVRHISIEEGDGAGYDILSYSNDGSVRFVEVKTTTGSINTPFYLTENERVFIEEYKENAEIVRVYEFDRFTKSGKIKRIKGKDFINEVELHTIAYKATIKKNWIRHRIGIR